MSTALSQRLVARYFALLLAASGIVSALVHPVPNLTDMTGAQRAAITLVCVLGAVGIWIAPWNRWPRWALYGLPLVGLGVKTWANLLGGLGPYSYSIHFVLIYVWIGVALPRLAPLAFSPLLAVAYVLPLASREDPRHWASVAMVVPICIVIGESVAWISSLLRAAEENHGRNVARLRWLVDASADLAHQHEGDALPQRIARLAQELPAATGAVLLLPGSDRGLHVAASCSWPSPLPDCFDVSAEPALREAMRSSRIQGRDDGPCRDLAQRLGVPFMGIAPLFGSSRCMGIVLLARSGDSSPLDSFTRDLVRTLATQAGLALERARTREALLDASLHDELTGIGNRRKANARLSRLAAHDALVLIDLDHFKRVNDSRGHAFGDQVLRDLAHFLDGRLREGDEVFRMGGEEFLVVLARAGPGAAMAAERLCAGWRGLDPATTFSAGIAVHEGSEAASATLARADAALYEAKGAGRDRVIASGECPDGGGL